MKKYTLKAISVLCALALCITAAFSVVPSVGAAATVYLRGTFNGWEAPADYAMAEDNNNHYLITIHLEKGSYEYKAATQDWSTFVAPKNDESGNVNNATLTLDYDCDVTFVVDKPSCTVQAYPHSSLESGVNKVALRSKWMEHDDLVLVQKNNMVSYQSASSSYPASAYWNIIPNGSGAYYLQNNSTKNYAALSGSAVICVAGANDGSTSWQVDTSTGAARFISVADPTAVINIERLSGSTEGTNVPMYYTSSQWGFEYSSYDYTLKPDKVIDTGYNAYANSSTSITSYMTGSKKTWTQSKDLSAYPAFNAPNSPLAAAVYNLTLEEAKKSIFTDNFGEVFQTGTNWQKVWTRDTALSNLYSLAWVFPEISYNCEREKIKTSQGISVFEQDTGTGGSYPVSTDKIITMLSVWETYLTDGNKDHLNYFYNVCNNTIMQDMGVAYDSDAGLFRGETCGLDWRDQTYPDWTSETYDSGLSTIAESKTTSVNAIYCRVLEIMSKAAKVLGKGEEAEQAWAKMAQDLEAKISDRLWNENMGLYSSWEYPEYMGSVLAEKTDVLGNGFALWFDIGTEAQLQSILENYPVVNYGADTVYPQKQGKLKNANKIYHNFGVWPGWDSILMVAASYHNNKELAEEIFNSNVRGAAVSLTNKEVINYRTGEGVESDQQLWSIAGTLAGYYRVMFGMNYDEDGITFNPYIPSWMEGPFELSNFKYRNSNLTIQLSGEGDKVKSFKVDGAAQDIDSYVFPVDSTGYHTIEIVMEKSGKSYNINKSEDNLVVCPEMPTMNYSNGRLSWNQKNGLTYKLWTGSEYIDVSGGSYNVDTSVYGCYSLMAISQDGICSELSKPIVISPNRIKIEAESGTVSDSSYISSGYVIDKRHRSADLTLTVNIAKKGRYLLCGIYNNSGDATSGVKCAIRSVYVDGVDAGTLVFPEVYSNHTNQLSTHLALDLSEGTHSVKIFYDESNWHDRNMDIADNNVEYNYFNFDYVGESKEEPTEPSSSESDPVSSESQPSDPITSESQPSDPVSSESQPSDPISSESQPSDPISSESQPSDPISSESQPSDPVSSESQPSDPVSSESQPTNPSSSDTTPTKPSTSAKTTVKASAMNSKIYVGKTTTIAYIINNQSGKVTFSSSNKKIATVSSKGVVKGIKKGSVVISVKNNGATGKVKITVVQRANPMTVKAKAVTADAKKSKTFAKAKILTIKNAKGTVTFKKTKGDKKITINTKTGKLTVKKGLKKKTYKVSITVKAAGSKTYKAKSKKVIIKVKVK